MINECFYHLTHLPELPHHIVEEAVVAEYQLPTTEGDPRLTPRTTRAPSTFINTKFCQDLQSNFGPVFAEFLRFNPQTGYDWHTDLGRNFAINFLLTPTNSLTLFKKPIDNLNYDLEVCDYGLFRPTLFNTQIDHSVLNMDHDIRYLLSVWVRKPVTYNSVRHWLLNYKTDGY